MCECHPGWIGPGCETRNTQVMHYNKKTGIYIIIEFFLTYLLAICTAGCVNGVCIGPDKCMCANGWTGNKCDQGNSS